MSTDSLQESQTTSRRYLEPYERISETLFGLIMVLTFTGSLSVAESGRADVRTMLIGAIGCNIAWGIIDGILYLMGCLNEQGRGIRALRAARAAESSDDAHRAISEVLPPMIADAFGPAELESARQKIVAMPPPPSRARLTREDWLGSLAVFFWVFITTLPVAIPFIFMQDIAVALRVSNGVAIALLFMTGYAFGRCAEYHRWWTGLAMVLLGSALVGITIALGG